MKLSYRQALTKIFENDVLYNKKTKNA